MKLSVRDPTQKTALRWGRAAPGSRVAQALLGCWLGFPEERLGREAGTRVKKPNGGGCVEREGSQGRIPDTGLHL